MNVASYELCKKLFELSAWGASEGQHWWSYYLDDDKVYEGRVDTESKHFVCPAYPLGYLLRKLPSKALVTFYKDTNWNASWGGGDDVVGSTPEDAVAKLCVELFK